VAAKQLVGVFYGVSWDTVWLSYQMFLILALIIKKIRYLTLAKPPVGAVYSVSCGVTLLSYQDFLVLALNSKKIRNLSKLGVD